MPEKAKAIDDFLSGTIESNGPSLVPLLQAIQQQFNYLPEEVLRRLAERTQLALIDIYRTATFYNSFYLVPRGNHQVVICAGTACHVHGASRLGEEISEYLGIDPGGITPNGEFSLETVNCLGCCAFAPVMVVDGQYHGNLKAGQAKEILRSLHRDESELAAKA